MVLPAALVVSSLALVTACSDDEESTTTQAGLPECAEVASSGDCQKCTEADGDTSCAGTADCFYNAPDDYCDEAIA